MKIIIYLMVVVLFISCQSNNTSTSDANGDGTNGSIINIISNPKDDLVGEYSTEEGGNAEIKITKENGNYFISVSRGNKWVETEQLDNVSDNDFAHLFGENWKSYVKAGLYTGAFSVFKVEKGYTYDNHTFKTGYFMVFMVGRDIYKIR